MIIRSGTKEEIEEVIAKIHYSPSRDVNSVALIENDVVSAMVLYDYWTYNSVNVHIWSSTSMILSTPYVREVFKYPFEDCMRKILIAVTPDNAIESLKLSSALGFKEVHRIKDGWNDGIDMIVKEMRKHECRWLLKKVA